MEKTLTLNLHILTQKEWLKFSNIIAFLLGVAIPVSNPLMNVSLCLIFICIFSRKNFSFTSSLIINPLIYLPAIMFFLLALSLITKNHDYGSTMVSKYMKLLYVFPLSVFFLLDKNRVKMFFIGFLFANALVLVVSTISQMGSTTLFGINPDNPVVFKLHITQNFFMSLAVLFWISYFFTKKGMWRIVYGIMAIFAIVNILFMVEGRTGYLSLFVGVGVLLLMMLSLRQIITAFIVAFIIGITIFIMPNKLIDRINKGVEEVKTCFYSNEVNKYNYCNTSMGQRTIFLMDAFKLIKQAPLLGNGAGSFSYTELNKGNTIHNPHNEYLIETLQIGLLGLVIFLSWLFFCFKSTKYQTGLYRFVFISILTSYSVCNLFNSFILDSSEGHFFVILIAMLAAGEVRFKFLDKNLSQKELSDNT